MKVLLIDYGAGNLWSIINAFKKIGVDAELAIKPEQLKDANAIVLPGVGNFGDAMQRVELFRGALNERINSGVPFLGLCLGIQVLMESSAESPGAKGLGLFKGGCKKFSAEKLKVPHMGWNTVKVVKDSPLLSGIEDNSYFYFVHSYYPAPKDKKIIAGETEYGIKFPSIISEKNVFATQFHPEKSSEKGLLLLKNFARLSKR